MLLLPKAGADQLLHQIGLLVGAARRGDAADRRVAVLGLDALELGRGRSIASSQVTSRHGSVILSRTIGFRMRSLCAA